MVGNGCASSINKPQVTVFIRNTPNQETLLPSDRVHLQNDGGIAWELGSHVTRIHIPYYTALPTRSPDLDELAA